MDPNSAWKIFYAERDAALRKGEQIAEAYEFRAPPVDPFRLLKAEQKLIHAVGEDFGDAFDGRIRYVGNRFLLCFNTKYNSWRHSGTHHSRVLFSIAHELGHYFLDRHRTCLVTNRRPHDSFSEFTAHSLIETEADHFAAGLLMPSYLVRKNVNRENFPKVDDILEVRRQFDVSLTGLLARWTQLSDFPCATVATYQGVIQFGWVSEPLRNQGCYRVRRNHAPECRYFKRFLGQHAPVSTYAQGEGSGNTDYWLDWENRSLDTAEMYFAIPHTGYVWTFLMCDESDLSDDRFD